MKEQRTELIFNNRESEAVGVVVEDVVQESGLFATKESGENCDGDAGIFG